MLTGPLQNPRTAKETDSIWNELTETTFRQHLVELEKRTNAVPVDPQTFSLSNSPHQANANEPRHILPLHVEQQLANHVAFIVAVEEGAQSVAAVCLEEWIHPPALKIRIAAVDTIASNVQLSLQSIAMLMRRVASTNSQTPSDLEAGTDVVFDTILQLHKRRLLGRLRSKKWTKPAHLLQSHKKPLWQDFANLIHRAEFLYAKKDKAQRRALEKCIVDLATVYEEFELIAADTDGEFRSLRNLVVSSYTFCKNALAPTFLSRLEAVRATAQVASALKCLRQVEKIGSYWPAARYLVQASCDFRQLFANLELDYLTPYASLPTTIAHESWAHTTHVHAEIQLVVDLDLRQRQLASGGGSGSSSRRINVCQARVVGTSKHLCYLCYLFLTYHGRLHPTNTHGRLYDQWTVPDLAEFSEVQRQRYRIVLQQIDRHVVEMARRPAMWRVEPMTSRQNLIEGYIEFVIRSEMPDWYAPGGIHEKTTAEFYTSTF